MFLRSASARGEWVVVAIEYAEHHFVEDVVNDSLLVSFVFMFSYGFYYKLFDFHGQVFPEITELANREASASGGLKRVAVEVKCMVVA